MRRAIVWFTVAALAAAAPLPAQEDFRSTDPDRPIRVEDAYPLKFFEWEWQLGSEVTLAEGSAYGVAGVLELKAGIARNWQAGVEIHPAWEQAGGISAGGVEEFGLHFLYNPNQESVRTPAFAVRGDLRLPGTGDVGREAAAGRLKAIATRSVGRARFHVNAGYEWAAAADGGDFWLGGLAVDYPIGLFSRSVLGDVYVEAPRDGADARVWLEIGSRWQISNASVLDFGLTSRFDRWADGQANVGIVIGLSRVFGIPGLVKVPPYPNPKID